MSSSNTSFKASEGNIDDEVNRIFKKNKGKSLYQLMEELKQKYKDEDVIYAVLKKYEDKMKRVKKIAEKIRDRLVTKYPNLNMKEYIEKITEYKQKYNFDDSEMQAIINLIFYKKDGLLGEPEFEPNLTEMSKALGFVPVSMNLAGELKVHPNEKDVLETIKGLAGMSRELHNQVIIQSLIYESLANKNTESVAYTKTFDKNKINLFSFVHPVVASLFLPKFKLLEEHMILAGIADIVYKKSEGITLNTQPEYELYWDISTDPAETACSTKVRPFTDLLDRANVQTKLWESVLSLRQGKYYTSDLSTFIMAIDKCKASVFDAADLAYVKDEGTILRKLFAAFSLRPTIVMTSPVYGITQGTSNISALASTHITTIPMITLRVPVTWYSQKVEEDVELTSAIQQDQLYIHHKQLTVKRQQILYSREILVFYVHRRYQLVNLARLSQPYTLASLPVTMSQFEQIMTTGVVLPTDNTFTIANQTFKLASAVTVQTQDVDTKLNVAPTSGKSNQIIIGCTAVIMLKDTLMVDLPPEYSGSVRKNPEKVACNSMEYKPLNLNTSSNDVEAIHTLPVSGKDSTEDRLTKYGTLFIFQESGKPKPEEVEPAFRTI